MFFLCKLSPLYILQRFYNILLGCRTVLTGSLIVKENQLCSFPAFTSFEFLLIADRVSDLASFTSICFALLVPRGFKKWWDGTRVVHDSSSTPSTPGSPSTSTHGRWASSPSPLTSGWSERCCSHCIRPGRPHRLRGRVLAPHRGRESREDNHIYSQTLF